MSRDTLKVAIAQIAPVLLDRERTLARVVAAVGEAADGGARLVCFGEALVPGYPVWLSRTDGARFDDAGQKQLHRIYAREAVDIERGDLDPVRSAARERGIWVVLGIIERPADRGGHSLYCTAVTVDAEGAIRSAHRKLVPTYEERLSWSPGDGHGLRTHDLSPFRVGTLNCWENWMPLARSALQAQGEDLHVALWPGSDCNTRDITRFMALEGRSYVVSASSLLRPADIPPDVPLREQMLADGEALLCNGGSAIAAPDGSWVVEPVVGEERVVTAELAVDRVYEERQSFDPVGHYSRPDVLRLSVDCRRQGVARIGEPDTSPDR